MGHMHALSSARGAAGGATRRPPLLRAADVVLGVLLLVVAAPLMAVLALAVRLDSTGPVLHRREVVDAGGRQFALLSFRTVLDGGGTTAHERVRAVVGAAHEQPLTRPGRFMRRLRLERLPRLFNVVAGHVSLFG